VASVALYLLSIVRRASIGGRRCLSALPLLLLAACALTPSPAQASETRRAFGMLPAALNLSIDLSSSAVQFFQEGRPGLIDGHQQVELRVTCLSGPWSVSAQATPLVEQQNQRQIGPDRIFIRSSSTVPQPDVGAGPGFVPMAAPVLIAEGSIPTYTTPLELRLLTDWSDTPGVYKGDILFTAVVRP
jgi:hypothetical protein